MTKPTPEPLLSVRTSLILLLAFIAGATATVLACLARNPLPGALLVGGSAAGGGNGLGGVLRIEQNDGDAEPRERGEIRFDLRVQTAKVILQRLPHHLPRRTRHRSAQASLCAAGLSAGGACAGLDTEIARRRYAFIMISAAAAPSLRQPALSRARLARNHMECALGEGRKVRAV